MKLVILAGGKGTRLGLADIPKPLVEVAGRSLLEHQIILARDSGIRDVFILSGYKAEAIYRTLGNGEKWGVRVTHVIEPFPLGTAGSVKLLEHVIEDRFLVFYGDVALGIDVQSFLNFDLQMKADATLLVHPNDHPYDSDLLEIDGEGRVTAFHSKPHAEGARLQNLVNAAVYVLSPEVFRHIPSGESTDFGRHIFPAMVRAGRPLAAFQSLDYAKDLGTPDRLERVRKDYSEGRWNPYRKRRAIFLDRDGVINRDMHDAPSAERFQLLPGVGEAIRSINQSDYLAVVVTNQPALAKGFLTEVQLSEIHKEMDTQLGKSRSFVDRLYYCPHHPQKGFPNEVPELKIACDCRKPSPGLFYRAANELNIDLSSSWMVGDHQRDIEAGQAAGCRTVLIGSSGEETARPDHEAGSLREAVDVIFKDKGVLAK